jgi:hypothetical protein
VLWLCTALYTSIFTQKILLTPRFVTVVLLKQQNIICYTAISTTYKDSFLLSPFLAILWFHMIIIFLDRPSSITNKTLKFSWQCNPFLSTRNDLTEIRVVNWNHDLSFDIWHKQCMCSLYFLFVSYFFSLYNFTCKTVYYNIKFNLS